MIEMIVAMFHSLSALYMKVEEDSTYKIKHYTLHIDVIFFQELTCDHPCFKESLMVCLRVRRGGKEKTIKENEG